MLGDKRRELEKKERIKAMVEENNKKRPVTATKKVASIKSAVKAQNHSPKAIYCRYCQQMLPPVKYFNATNLFIDKNGKMSICTNCIQDIYDKNFLAYQDMSKAMFLTCQDIDLFFDDGVVVEVKNYFENTKDSKFSIMSKYKALVSVRNKNTNIRFRDTKIESEYDKKERIINVDLDKDRVKKWGTFPKEDAYEFLEETYNLYVDSYGADSPSEKDSFKTLALLLYRQREEPTNKDVTSALKEQLKLCGISPEQQRKEKSDKGSRTFGVDIAIFENTDPITYIPEWEKETNRYKDYDGLESDKKDIIRNMHNFFVEGSRDFKSEGVDISLITDSEEDED